MKDQSIAELKDQLARFGSSTEKLAVIEALERRRREERFICYWEPTEAEKTALKAFTGDIKIFGVLGGNRSGKTELGAFVAVAWALGKGFFTGEPIEPVIQALPIPDKPCEVWVVGLSFALLRDIIWREKLRQGKNHPAIIPKDPAVVRKASDTDFQIFFSNGSTITGKSADSGREKFQGASVDLVWIDEECESDVFDECYQRTVDCSGKILLTMTPLADINSGVRKPWVFELYQESEKTGSDCKFVRLSVLDNPYVPAAEKQKLKEKWAGHPEEGARLYGTFVQRSGMVYKMWNPKKHMVPRKRITEDWYRIACIDPAPSGPTACVWAALDPSGNMYVEDVYKQEGMTISEHARNILAQNGGKIIDLWLIDPRGGNQRNAETHRTAADVYRAEGIAVRFPNLDEDFGRDRAREYLNSTLEESNRHPKCWIFDDLKQFKEEIERYVWDNYARGEMKGLSKDKPRKGFDDILNCWQYIAGHLNGRKPPRHMQSYYSQDLTPEQKQQYAQVNSY